MISLRWVMRSESGYGLGTRVSGLAHRVGDADILRYAASPVLHDLAVATGRVVHLAMLEGPSIYYLDKVGGGYADVPTRVGARASAARTALGKAMLSSMSPEQVEAQLTGSARATGQRAAFVELHAQLDKVRQRKGVSIERGEFGLGAVCVGVPLRARDCPLGAISVVCSAQDDLERVASLALRSGLRATHELQRSRLQGNETHQSCIIKV